MNDNIIIIGNGNVGKYLYQQLSNDFNCEKISARKIFLLIEKIKFDINHILLSKGKNINLIDTLKKGEHIIFAGKGGKLLDFFIDAINEQCPEYKNNFYIFGTNGAIDYGDSFPRFVLNSSIKEEQLEGESPASFKNSVLYHPNPGIFEEKILGKLNLNSDITKDTKVFYKEFYLKLCLNAFLNSLCIIYDKPILYSIEKYEKKYPHAINNIISELYSIIYSIKPNLLSKVEISNIIYNVKNTIPNIYPSSVGQFWKEKKGKKNANYEESDVGITLGWLIKYANNNKIIIPYLNALHNIILNLS